jgi:hypothetical protein
VSFAGIAELDGHGFRASLTQPEMFHGVYLATHGSKDFFARQRTFPASFSEVDAEQTTLPKVLEVCGTAWVETLRHHRAPRSHIRAAQR